MSNSLLSIGFTLLVLALTLIVQWRVMKGGKKVSLQCIGVSLMVLGAVIGALVIGVAIWTQGLSSQVWGVFKDTTIAIVLTGGVLAIEGVAQKKPSNLPWVKCGAFVVMIIGVGFIIWALV